MKRLIINADDYGMSISFNKGILELIEKGIVTSTTVMINRKSVRPKDLLKFKSISIGLHLELSEKSSLQEIEKQIKIFKKKFGQLPSHLDGHKYCHLLPHNLPEVIKIAKKYKLPMRSVHVKDRRIIKKNKIKTPDKFISWHPKRKMKLFNDLRSAKDNKTELLCHPGYFDPKSRSSYNKQRKMELEIFKSKRLKKLIDNFELINYRQI